MNKKIYILKYDCPYYTDFDLFKDISDRHYIQYKKKGDDKYSIKRGTLTELVGEYEYGDDKLLIELVSTDITF